MKNNALLIVIFFFFSCQNAKEQKDPEPIPTHSFAQVKAVAAKYGLPDSISLETHGLLMYFAQEHLDAYFQRERAARELKAETAIFHERTKGVRSFDDYVALINAFPHTQKSFVNAHGGEKGFEAWKAGHKGVRWHVYRNEHGGVMFVSPDFNKVVQAGYERIDTLP